MDFRKAYQAVIRIGVKMFPSMKRQVKMSLQMVSLVIACLLMGLGFVHGHSGKAKYHIVIDTDAAPDDLRAACLCLASPEIEVLAITTSDGALNPKEGLVKVRALLKSFGHEGIPSGMGRIVLDKAPAWRNFCRRMQWGEEESFEVKTGQDAVGRILSAIENEEEPVFLVCMGGLTNIAGAIKANPQIKKGILKIVWYNDSLKPLAGTNYEIDKSAAHDVLSSGISMEMISDSGGDAYPFSAQLLQAIEVLTSPYAEKIAASHKNPEVQERMESGHLKMWDDLLPVYLLYPGLFGLKTEEREKHRLFVVHDMAEMESKYREILMAREAAISKVFKGFPETMALFADDVRPHIEKIIRRYGREEWRMGVLTNELHGHLGIYAVIGAKMGLRARRYFHIGVDDISITSYAGTKPPLSCLNDGLQVSTGGTVGHGLITVDPQPPFRPEATFEFKGRIVRLRLRDTFWDKIRSDIKKGIDLYKLDTENYWLYVRELALHYWVEWDKMDLFTME